MARMHRRLLALKFLLCRREVGGGMGMGHAGRQAHILGQQQCALCRSGASAGRPLQRHFSASPCRWHFSVSPCRGT